MGKLIKVKVKNKIKNMKKFWLISLLFTGLIFAGTNLVMAQQTLPTGGDSFETATLIQSGKYQSGPLNEEAGLEKYYFIQGIKPGQEIKIKGVFIASNNTYGTRNRMVLYNEEREELLNVDDLNNSSVALSASWLPNSDQSTYKYYLKVADEGLWHTQSFSLEISLVDRYDANSQTDAGDSIDKALAIAPVGNYQSYLAGCYDCLPFDIQEGGTDFKDFYKIAVKKGQTLNIEVVPPSEAEMELAIYNTKRQLLESKTAENEGAIINTSLDVINDGDIFVAVICGDYCSSKLVAYTLNTTTAMVPGEKPVIGEVACDEDYDCPVGLVCLNDQCVSECVSDSECEKGLVCQEGVCVYDNIFNDFFKQSEGEEGVGKGFPSMISGILFSGWRFWLSLALMIIFYIYFAICLQTLAKKTNTSNGWLAWIPVANVFLMIQIAQKPLWWFILLLIPIVNIVIGVILWMKIAERRGKPNWVGILIIVPVVGIIIPSYLAFSGKEKIEITPPYTGTGTQEANKPVVGYKHPCKYCGKLIPPNSTVCPFCEKANPLGPYRCPKCHEPIEKEWQVCPNCNQNLRIVCPYCGKITFFGDHCEDCGARLFVKCPHCGQEQPPLSDNCIKCGKPLKVEKR
ncbi:MAG TPA: zinc ribbon domain-containing protein [Candidatus Paceibacterota bacterium]|nr:zinc ribbon domain-containing protein [Candidatus Paceibacterota bacterium]